MAKPSPIPYAPGPEPEPYSVGLRFTGGGSDKVYELSVEAAGGGWVVNYANGRYGGTLATGSKTSAPVAYDKAAEICRKQLAEKVGKGYLPVKGSRLQADATVEAIAAVERRSSGFVPQLLNDVLGETLEATLADDAFVAQEKHNGERRPVIVTAEGAVGANKKGQSVALPSSVATALMAFGRDLTLDCELIGETLHVFDMVGVGAPWSKGGPGGMRDISGLSFENRFKALTALGIVDGPNLRLSQVVVGEEAKRALVRAVQERKGEGVVFRRASAHYVAGKPNSGGDVLRHKFWHSLSATVSKVNDKRSVALSLVSPDGSAIGVGNVTIPTNRSIPTVGEVVEVRYQYAFDGGSLYQPTFLGTRNDVDASECLASQRVFAPVAEMAHGPAASP